MSAAITKVTPLMTYSYSSHTQVTHTTITTQNIHTIITMAHEQSMLTQDEQWLSVPIQTCLATRQQHQYLCVAFYSPMGNTGNYKT